MMKCFELLAFLIFLTGCATTGSFGAVYNNAVASGKSVIIIKENDFLTIRDHVNEHFEALGYQNVIYSKPKEGFLVVVKKIPVLKSMLIGDPHTDKIILKYTKMDLRKTRIDLVNGSVNITAIKTVDADIQKMAELIRAD